MAELKLVVGLGNPGPEYAETRHNLGFKVIESLEEALGIAVKQQKFGAGLVKAGIASRKVMLMKPWQYMNRSGQAVATAVGFYKLDLDDVMVITDDMALEPGVIRVRVKGSAGGHNGLADIIARAGQQRIRPLPGWHRQLPRCRSGRLCVGPAERRRAAVAERGDRSGPRRGAVLDRIRHRQNNE